MEPILCPAYKVNLHIILSGIFIHFEDIVTWYILYEFLHVFTIWRLLCVIPRVFLPCGPSVTRDLHCRGAGLTTTQRNWRNACSVYANTTQWLISKSISFRKSGSKWCNPKELTSGKFWTYISKAKASSWGSRLACLDEKRPINANAAPITLTENVNVAP